MRKIVIFLHVITIVLSIYSIITTFALQQRINNLENSVDTILAEQKQSSLTPKQQREIDEYTSQLNDYEDRVGVAIAITYIYLFGTIVGGVIIIVYLTRPKVQLAFRDIGA